MSSPMSGCKPTPATEASTMPEPRRQKVAPKDAEFFQPSSFASREAQADAHNAKLKVRRLVSPGPADFLQRNLKTGKLKLSRSSSSPT